MKKTNKRKSNRISLNDAMIAKAVAEIKAMTVIDVSTTAIIRAAVVNQLARLKTQHKASTAPQKDEAK